MTECDFTSPDARGTVPGRADFTGRNVCPIRIPRCPDVELRSESTYDTMGRDARGNPNSGRTTIMEWKRPGHRESRMNIKTAMSVSPKATVKAHPIFIPASKSESEILAWSSLRKARLHWITCTRFEQGQPDDYVENRVGTLELELLDALPRSNNCAYILLSRRDMARDREAPPVRLSSLAAGSVRLRGTHEPACLAVGENTTREARDLDEPRWSKPRGALGLQRRRISGVPRKHERRYAPLSELGCGIVGVVAIEDHIVVPGRHDGHVLRGANLWIARWGEVDVMHHRPRWDRAPASPSTLIEQLDVGAVGLVSRS
ncbi:hypothetical protein OF83DRAFT_1080222 [Amylostereum chailletii]|nr:hypothetical protein OF83DRAFT_1080222 [Amylostereum chailletii]